MSIFIFKSHLNVSENYFFIEYQSRRTLFFVIDSFDNFYNDTHFLMARPCMSIHKTLINKDSIEKIGSNLVGSQK